MSHIRTQIRAAFGAILDGSDDAGSRVFQRRTLPLSKTLEPTFIFSVQNEQSRDLSMDGSQERVAEIRATACAKGDAATTEDVIDRMALWAETQFAADPTLGGTIATYEYRSIEYSFSGEGEQTFCTAGLTFALTYYTKCDNPETSI